MMMNQKMPTLMGGKREENWLAQYEAEREKEQKVDGLASVAISTVVEEVAYCILLLRCVATGSTRELLAVCTEISRLSKVSFFLWE